MTFPRFIFATILYFQYVGAVPRVDPLVDSKAGLIRGQAATDGDYNAFVGIPYAKVDEANPFGPSVPYPKFEDTFAAFNDSPICPQVSLFDNTTIVGTIDCLHLNVYVPTTATSSRRLPVLVWIHGGWFQFGFAARNIYGPKFLVRHDVILVTLNYRLGPYGFMCVDSPTAPGNQGLKDQRLALKWVKENIEAFGGDADKITIFGVSAGGVSVDFHVRSNQDLFHQAILQSGTILVPWAVSNPRDEGPLKLAKHLGHTTTDVEDALSFLASIDSNLVIAATHDLGLIFRMCIENNFDDVEPFLTDHPINLVPSRAKRTPMLIGFNNEEGLVFQHEFDPEYLSKTLSQSFNFDSDTFDEIYEIVKHYYFGDENVSEEAKRPLLNLAADFQFLHPTQRSLRKFFDSGVQSIFSYMFTYVGERNYNRNLNNFTYGEASHADELSYLFDVGFVDGVLPAEDRVIVDRITKLWTNFAKYGNPTPKTSELLPVKWVPATRDQWNYLNIDSELTMGTRPFSDRMAFLDLLYKANEQHQIGFFGHEN